MRRHNSRSRIALVPLAVLAVAATAAPMLPVWLGSDDAPRAVAGPAPAAHALVVDLRDDATEADIRDLETRYGVDLEFNSVHAEDDNLLRADVEGQDAGRLLERLRTDARVEVAEPELRLTLPERPEDPLRGAGATSPGEVASSTSSDARPRFTPNDPRYREQWNLRMVGAEAAWERSRGKGVVVAVIDTGVAAKDSDRGKQARDFGQTHFTRGYDFVNDDDDPYDDHGHGTHVSGTIAESTDNREGVAGLAFEATIQPIKVLSAMGSGTSTDIADAIRFAADNGAGVINLSLGSPHPSDVIHSAVKYARRKGVVIVCAAGNGFEEGVIYPAAFPECIAVSSVGPSGDLATYSSWGKEVALAAPGGDMLASGKEADGILQNTVYPVEQGGKGDDYYHFQGTSMASPHVAAAAALVMAQGVRDPARVRDLLERGTTPKAPKKKYGAGILSASKSTALAAGTTSRRSDKRLLFGVLAALILFLPRRIPFGLRLAVVAAVWAGYFGPDHLAATVGANSAWNLVTFSALIPFLLFWEMESRVGSKIVAGLALGVGIGLVWNLLTGALPFTATAFGDRALPWTVANAAASFVIAAAAWRRSRTA